MAAAVRAVDVLAQILFTASLAIVGGVFNHMRGEDGGMLRGSAFSGFVTRAHVLLLLRFPDDAP